VKFMVSRYSAPEGLALCSPVKDDWNIG